RGLTRLGFHHVTEVHARSCEGCLKYVRVRGGLPETIRFFHTIAPAISRKRDIEGRAVKSGAALRVVSIEPLSREVELVDITTGTGDFIANSVISHNCYARRTHWFLDQDGVNGWGSRIFVKVNAPEVLRRELAQRSWTREEVHLGTATDPYQPAEGAYKISRQILEVLLAGRTPVDIVTRSTMVVRDVDILRQLADGAGAARTDSPIRAPVPGQVRAVLIPAACAGDCCRIEGQAWIRSASRRQPLQPKSCVAVRSAAAESPALRYRSYSRLWRKLSTRCLSSVAALSS